MYLSLHDGITGLITIGVILIVLLTIEIAVKKWHLDKFLGRKILHLISICACAWDIQVFENKKFLAFTFLLFFLLLLGVIKKGWLQVNANRTFGIAYFPLAFFVLLVIPVLPVKVIFLLPQN